MTGTVPGMNSDKNQKSQGSMASWKPRKRECQEDRASISKPDAAAVEVMECED